MRIQNSNRHILTVAASALLSLCPLSHSMAYSTMGAYTMTSDTLDRDVPKGYKPVYVVQISRTSMGEYSLASSIREACTLLSDKANLTSKGRKLAKTMDKIRRMHPGDGALDGDLTEVHKGIAQRFMQTYKDLPQDKVVRLHGDGSDQAHMAAAAFMLGLPDNQAMTARGNAWLMPLTNEERTLMEQTDIKPWHNGERWASDIYKVQPDASTTYRLLKATATVKRLLATCHEPHMLDAYISDDDARVLADLTNQRLWSAAGLSPDAYGYALESASGTLTGMITTAIESMNDSKAKADVYFVNATEFHRLMSVIGFNNLSDETVNRLDKFMPLAANLRIVWYSNGKKLISKFVLNEQDKRMFGLPNEMSPYEEWRRVYSYLNKRMAHFGMQRTLKHMTGGAVYEPHGQVVWEPSADGHFGGIMLSHPIETGGGYGEFVLQPAFIGQDGRTENPVVQNEQRNPDYFAANVGSMKVELTGMSHTGFTRLTYSQPGKATLTLSPCDLGGEVGVDTAKQILWANTPVVRPEYGDTIVSHAVVMTSLPIEDYKVVDNSATVTFDVTEGDELMAKIAGSLVTQRSAMYNIEQEIPHWEFYDTRMRNVTAWERRMRQLSTALGREADQADYDTLYTQSMLPRTISDKNGRYPSFGPSPEYNVKSLGKIGNKPIHERVFADFPVHEGLPLMDYQLTHGGLMVPYINSMLYAYEESGCMDEATVLFICRAVNKKMQNIKKDKLLAALKASAKTEETRKAVDKLEAELAE